MLLRWHDRTFGELSAIDLYAITELRERVFVVERIAAYLDADGLDRAARHLWAEAAKGDAIVAYLRILQPGTRFAEASLGRIVTAPEVRRTGLGRALVTRGLVAVGAVPVRIAAPDYLEPFYGGFGFRRAGEPYLAHGGAHIEMLRP